MLTLRSEASVVEIDPEHGAEILSLRMLDGPNALAWHDWRAPAPADQSTSYGSTQLDWLSRYRGGWQELFPNAGAACEVGGVPLAFHGEASLSRWEVLSADSSSCELAVGSRLPLVLNRTMELAATAPTLRIEETVTNVGASAVDFIWGHHPAFPAIAGAQVDLPSALVRAEPETPGDLGARPGRWPEMEGADGSIRRLDVVPAEEMVRLVYATELDAGWASLRQPHPQPGVALSWDLETFPCLWIWLQNGGREFPWYGRARMIALEPHAAAPFDGLAAAVKRGEAHRLEPGESRSTWLTMTLLDCADDPVVGVGQDGAVQVGSR